MKALLCAALVSLPLTGAFAQSLPAVDTLTTTSSFAAFVAPDVPLDLHRQALRRLWALTPALSGPDLLDIHAEGASSTPATVQSAAQAVPATSLQQASVVPPVETLSRESDYTAYLANDVPLGVHQAAMRRLWSTHPEFARYIDDLMHSADFAETSPDKPQTHAAVMPASAAIYVD